MITPDNFKDVLDTLGFRHIGDIYSKEYEAVDAVMIVDTAKEKLLFPNKIGNHDRNDTYSDSLKENLVVFECVDRLLTKGYRPEHITLEKQWNLGHDAKGGRADICVEDIDGTMLFIIECKTFGKEYEKEKKNTLSDGGQLFSYWQQEKSAKWLALYASDYQNGEVTYQCECIDCRDDDNIKLARRKDKDIKLFEDSHTVSELHETWVNTYNKKFQNDVIFHTDTQPYQIGILPLRKRDLKDFSENDKVVNSFEEILRHNNVSDKENAFNRLTALFICKLVDEIKKGENQEVEFQYKNGTDTYESLQDRLQKLHQQGMQEFMKEEIFYVPDNYAENLIWQYSGQKRTEMISNLKSTIRKLKYFTNNDFAFKDVHNEELFLQNAKILVEVVELFQNYRIIGSRDIQKLGDLFEQLLNKGFKQNEGQFFTPIPITRFIWDCLPLEKEIHRGSDYEYPKIIDYACGAGHFLTEGVEAVNAWMKTHVRDWEGSSKWTEHKLFGVEKDYRLARVSKISLFMHGAGDGNIIFGDGLENYAEKDISPTSFDILVANPPYSVSAFKPHLNLKNNELDILKKISDNGSEIETLFVERIAQLLKPKGIAAVILPSSILNKENESFVAARESILKNFFIRCIAQFGSKTFGATGTNTVILFLEKFDEPPKRSLLLEDSVEAILKRHNLEDWDDQEIFEGYLNKIKVSKEDYLTFLKKSRNYQDWSDNEYFAPLVNAFTATAEFLNKQKQPSYRRLSSPEQQKWCNEQFYEFALKIEREKLFYYALVYNQTSLIISAPDDNKAQENFLGYTWSNRKGQEGIQIKKPGGLLYDEKERESENTLAALVRHAFADEEIELNSLDEYYYYLPLQDMLDFSDVKFNKSIKTTKLRNVQIKPGMTLFRLNNSDNFSLSIGNRVLTEEIQEDGFYPVYSANVYEEFGRISKQNLTDFSKPSILWGIDGDWMVNCIPANQPFYPTDHCGVLRVNTDKILPEYLAIALRIEGEHERFSRSNRASTQRIRNLSIQVPDIEIQKQIMSEMKAIDEQINSVDNEINQLIDEVKSKFDEMFGNDKETLRIGNVANISRGASPRPISAYITEDNDGINWIKIGDVKPDDVYIEKTEQKITKAGAALSHAVKSGDFLLSNSMSFGRPYILRIDGCVHDGWLVISNYEKKLNQMYLYYELRSDFVQSQFVGYASGTTVKNLNTDIVSKIEIVVPDVKKQENFAGFVDEIDEQKSAAQERKDQLIQKRNEAVNKYFR